MIPGLALCAIIDRYEPVCAWSSFAESPIFEAFSVFRIVPLLVNNIYRFTFICTSYIQFELLVEKFNYIYNETNIQGALLI